MRKIYEYERGGEYSSLPQNGGNSFMMSMIPQQLSLNSFSNFQNSQLVPKVQGLPSSYLKTSAKPTSVPKIASSVIGGADTQRASFMDTKMGQGMGAVGGMLGSMYDTIPTADKVHNENDNTMADIRSTANKALLSGAVGPWGMAAGAANMLIDKTGGFTDGSKGLGGPNDTLNSIAALALPGAGWFTGKTMDYKVSDTLKSSAGYTGTAAKGQTAAQNAGAKILFGKGKANSMIANASMRDNKVQDITNRSQMDFAASNNSLLGLGTQLQLGGGYQQANMRAGKSGLKIDREFAQRIIKLSKGKKKDRSVRLEEVAGFKDGGSINVIPEGALHAHKHHLDDVDEKFEDVTCKGIPVVTESEGGSVTQHAEVERNEIIFCLEVTEQIEKLMKEGSDDAAITAGKLLVHEILENTEDNTGLIEEVD